MLDWRESYGASGQALRFVVDELRLTAEGWAADVAVANDTRVAWRIERRGTASRFGVQLFADMQGFSRLVCSFTRALEAHVGAISDALPAHCTNLDAPERKEARRGDNG